MGKYWLDWAVLDGESRTQGRVSGPWSCRQFSGVLVQCNVDELLKQAIVQKKSSQDGIKME